MSIVKKNIVLDVLSIVYEPSSGNVGKAQRRFHKLYKSL